MALGAFLLGLRDKWHHRTGHRLLSHRRPGLLLFKLLLFVMVMVMEMVMVLEYQKRRERGN
jgi:hypothetical protein